MTENNRNVMKELYISIYIMFMYNLFEKMYNIIVKKAKEPNIQTKSRQSVQSQQGFRVAESLTY